MKTIKVHAPATIANVACGFDILGFAIESSGDMVTASLIDKPGVFIKKIYGDNNRLPLDTDKNTVAVAIKTFFKHIKYDKGIEIELHKELPLASGLGSSAASAAAGVYAANYLLGNPLTRKELIPFAMEAERVACGTAHADNVAPALIGGFVLIRSYNPLDIIKIPYPTNLFCTIISPDIEIRTEDARRMLKKDISLKNAVVQWGNIAGLITGLMKKDMTLISRSLEDVLIEPVRSILIPGFDNVKQSALNARVLGCSISGSGPSIFALSSSQQIAEKAGVKMKDEFDKLEIGCNVHVSRINKKGTKVIYQN